MQIKKGQVYGDRTMIKGLLGGDLQKGITVSSIYPNNILLFSKYLDIHRDGYINRPFANDEEYYFTGIGRQGNQNDPTNHFYRTNKQVIDHIKSGSKLLLFEETAINSNQYVFLGEYELVKAYQNTELDYKRSGLRTAYKYHLKKKNDDIVLPD